MARRVSVGKARDSALGNYPNIFADLALLGNNEEGEEGEIAPEDLNGAAQPDQFVGADKVMPDWAIGGGIPNIQDEKQNQYLASLKNISQLPNVMSPDEEVRSSALQKLNGLKEGNEDSFRDMHEWAMNQEPKRLMEKREGNENALRGMAEWLDKTLTKPTQGFQRTAQREAEKTAGLPIENIPHTQTGKLRDPLEVLREQVNANPELMKGLPPETQQKLLSIQPNPEKEFVSPNAAPVEQASVPEAIPEQPMVPHAAKPTIAQPETPNAAANLPKVPPEQPISEDMINDYPEKGMKIGAVKVASEDPLIKEDMEKLNNLVPISNEEMERAQRLEQIFQKDEQERTAEEQQIVDQAKTGEMSTLDKIALGIAIAAPILVALRYGAEGMESAGAGIKAFGEKMGQQQEQAIKLAAKGQKRLNEIKKERLQAEEKHIDLTKKIMDAIPNKEAKGFLKDKKVYQFGNKLGIALGDPKNALFLDAHRLGTDAEDIKKARETIEKAEPYQAIVNQMNNAFGRMKDYIELLPKDTNFFDILSSKYGAITSAGGLIKKFGPIMVKMKDEQTGETKEVNIIPLLAQQAEELKDLYRKSTQQQSTLTKAVEHHWGGLSGGDIEDIRTWLSGTNRQTVQDKIRILQNNLNQNAVESLSSVGFLEDPLKRAYPYEKGLKPIESEESVLDQIRKDKAKFLQKVM